MTDMVKVKRALLSVSDKSGLEALAAALVRHGVELVPAALRLPCVAGAMPCAMWRN